MKLSNKTLGTVAMISAPFLLLEMCSDYKFGLGKTAAAGICDLVYMIGWICSIVGLINLKATGTENWGKNLLRFNLVLLGFACIWNIWEAFDPGNNSTTFRILDCFWPASNVMLFITGIVIAVQGKVKGLARYAPLVAGFWLGFAMLFGAIAGGRNELSFYVTGAYSVVAWFLMGLAVYRSASDESKHYPTAAQFA